MNFKQMQVQNWLMNKLEIAGLGKVHFLVKSASAYYSWLRDDLKVDPALIHYSLATAEAHLVASRNDVLLVYPGAYLESAELAWDKANTHMIGMGGVNHGGDWSEPNVCIYTSGTAVATVLNVTGANVQFHNFTAENYGNNAACLSAMIVDKYGFVGKNLGIHGVMTTNQNTTAAAASLYLAADGMYPIFEDCQIGQDVWGTRSAANSGHLRYSDSTGRPNGSIFRRCKFLSRSITATCALVAVPAAQCIGRSHFFDNCHFSNFYDGTTLLNQVFYTVTGTQQFTIQLHNCSQAGFTQWQQGDFSVMVGDMPITGLGGGQMRQLDASVGS